MSSSKITIRNLTVDLREDEWRARAESLAQKMGERGEVSAEASEVAKTFKARIEGIDKDIARLQNAVRSHREVREVECEMRPNYADKVMELWRLDTMKIVETRPMTPEERQRDMLSEHALA